ncbi:MAG: type II secretion system protein [Candidatus Paceibacteria bacterium]
MYTQRIGKHGFSLIELLITVAIIAILAAVVYANFGTAGGKGRDTKRQSDLRLLQGAIEQYKSKYGQYPAQGCGTNASTFATEAGCSDYVQGLVPEFLPRLPSDPRAGSNRGFAYITNSSGSVYKVMVMNTVESEIVTYSHPMRSCDMETVNRPTELTGVDTRVMCGEVIYSSGGTPSQCREDTTRFQRSYGVWGGYAEKTTTSNSFTASGSTLDLTQRVICR